MVCMVTGCSSGFGRLAALELSARGHTVYAGVRDLAAGEALAAESRRGPIRAIRLDVTNEGEQDAAVAKILADEGRIDALVNNAGVALGGFLEQVDNDELRRLFDVNVFAVHALTSRVLPTMRAQRAGTVVMISSMSGRMAMPGLGAYAASKFALEGMSEAWRHELAPFGVRVALVEPGPYKTDIFEKNRSEARRTRDPASPYAPYVATLEVELGKALQTAGDPLDVARVIADLIEAPSPGLRHPMGPNNLMRRVLMQLPFAVREAGIRRKIMTAK